MRSQILLSWASWMASISVVMISSAWLLAELSSSPFINSLLVGAQNLPAFLPLKRSIKGFSSFLLATILLELIVIFLYFDLSPNWLLIISTLGVALLASLGEQISLLPMTKITLKGENIRNELLQKSSDIGELAGIIIGGAAYPYFKLFPPAILLALAPAWLSRRHTQVSRKQPHQKPEIPQSAPPLDFWCLLQGFCIGSLFALLPLWVISVKDGTSLDFSFIFGAFMLGSIFASRLIPNLPIIGNYFLCTFLIFIAFLPLTPLWLDVIIFIPLGASITHIELQLTDQLEKYGELSLRRDILLRSQAVAAVFGSITMGIIGQVIGVTPAILLVSLVYCLAGLVTWRWNQTTSGLSTN